MRKSVDCQKWLPKPDEFQDRSHYWTKKCEFEWKKRNCEIARNLEMDDFIAKQKIKCHPFLLVILGPILQNF